MNDNGNVIQFGRVRKNDAEQWIADISLFEDEGTYSARILDASSIQDLCIAEVLRKIADCLDTISFMARQEAEECTESDQGPAIAVFTVFADGTIRSRLDEEKVVSDEGFSFVADCLDLASIEVRKGAL